MSVEVVDIGAMFDTPSQNPPVENRAKHKYDGIELDTEEMPTMARNPQDPSMVNTLDNAMFNSVRSGGRQRNRSEGAPAKYDGVDLQPEEALPTMARDLPAQDLSAKAAFDDLARAPSDGDAEMVDNASSASSGSGESEMVDNASSASSESGESDDVDLQTEEALPTMARDLAAQDLSAEAAFEDLARAPSDGDAEMVDNASSASSGSGESDDVDLQTEEALPTMARDLAAQDLSAEAAFENLARAPSGGDAEMVDNASSASSESGDSVRSWLAESDGDSVNSEFEDYKALINVYTDDVASNASDASALSDLSDASEGATQREEQQLIALLNELSEATGGKKK